MQFDDIDLKEFPPKKPKKPKVPGKAYKSIAEVKPAEEEKKEKVVDHDKRYKFLLKRVI